MSQETSQGFKIPSAKEIYEYLNEYVIGQDEAKKTISLAVYNHYMRILYRQAQIQGGALMDRVNGINPDLVNVNISKSNLLVLGDSGTGKTFIIKKIAEMLGVPCYIADMTRITENGYVGSDFESALTGLIMEANGNVALAECGIVVLDEIDKIRKKDIGGSVTADPGGTGVQQALLKALEGTIIGCPPNGGRIHPEQKLINIDTTNILFIGLGAFVGIEDFIKSRVNPSTGVGFTTNTKKKSKFNKDTNYLKYVTSEDLRDFGFIPELIGRLPIITYTNPLKDEDLVRILTDPKDSIVKQYQKLLAANNVKLEFDKDALKLIAKKANEAETGARGLRGILEKILFDTMFEYSGSNNNDIVIVKITKKQVLKILEN